MPWLWHLLLNTSKLHFTHNAFPILIDHNQCWQSILKDFSQNQFEHYEEDKKVNWESKTFLNDKYQAQTAGQPNYWIIIFPFFHFIWFPFITFTLRKVAIIISFFTFTFFLDLERSITGENYHFDSIRYQLSLATPSISYSN